MKIVVSICDRCDSEVEHTHETRIDDKIYDFCTLCYDLLTESLDNKGTDISDIHKAPRECFCNKPFSYPFLSGVAPCNT